MRIEKQAKRILLCCALAILSGQAEQVSSTPAGETSKRPNVVFIVADDQRHDMLGCTGNPYAKTPNLDRLASEGVRFDRAFVNTAICMPSRASFFTGKHPHNAGAPNILHMPHTFHRNETPFPARLHQAGYHTAHFGKWHLGEGLKRQPGYDHWAGYYASSTFFDPTIATNGKKKDYKGFTDFIVADMAAEHIREIAGKEQPFFLFMGLAAPHINFGYPEEYETIFDGVNIPQPASFDEDYELTGKAPFMKEFIGVKDFIGGMPFFDNSWEKYVTSYYRSSQSIDESVGRVLAALEEAGVADDTLVIYTSDHGYSLGEHGLTEKHFAYEGVIRIPMLVRYPKKIQPGTVRNDLVTNMDVAPTCLELCGVDIPSDIEGESWGRLFEAGEGDVDGWRDDIFYFLEDIHMAVRTQRYKYITSLRPHPPELYDLDKDPKEMVNCASDPYYADIVAEMQQRLARQVQQTGLTPRVNQPVRSPYLLGPVPADQEAAVVAKAFVGRIEDGATVTVGDRTYTWKQVAPAVDTIPMGEYVGGNGNDRFLLGFGIEQLSERDPFVRVFFSENKAALRGWVDGELLYDRRTEAHPAELNFNGTFNPPLKSGTNTLIFAGAVEDFPNSKVVVMTWKGKSRLVE